MQKKIIALAIAAAASSAAFAQSNVTIYGIADMYVGSADVGKGMERQSLVNSGGLSTSRLGFRGTEDLGNGLKALFVIESALNYDLQGTAAGTSGVFGANRQTLLGLTGGFGTVAAGRLQTTGYDWGVKFGGGVAGSALSPLQNLTTNAGLIGGTNATAARLPNAVAYITPNLSGFSAAVNYTTSATKGESLVKPNDDITAYMLSGTYENGPLAAGLVYARTNAPSVLAADRKDWALGGSYDLKVVKLSATYQTTRNVDLNGQAGDTDKTWSVSATAPVSAAGAVHFQYAKSSIGSANNADAKGWALAYTHGLSKRTTAYAGYSRMSNDNANNVGVANDAVVNTVNNGQNASVVAVGLRHSF